VNFDDDGKNRLAAFAAQLPELFLRADVAADIRCTRDFRPTEGRLYFRKND
jgi:hypothetical protein